MKRREFLGLAAGTGALNLLKPQSAAAALAGVNLSADSHLDFKGLEPLGNRSFRFLTDDTSYLDARPVFSPDGKYVLFMRTPVTNQDISTFWIVPSNGGGEAVPFYSNASLQATRPDWSRTRRSFQIAFTGQSSQGLGLYLLDVFTKKTAVILPPGGHKWSYPSWYPDGNHLAVTNYDDFVHQIVQTDLKGNLTPLTDSQVVWAGMSSVSQTDGHPPSRLPDRRRPQDHRLRRTAITKIPIKSGYRSPWELPFKSMTNRAEPHGGRLPGISSRLNRTGRLPM